MVVDIPGFGRHIGHARIRVDGTDGVTHCFVLLLNGHMALIVFVTTGAAVQEEFGEFDVTVSPLIHY